MIISTPGKHKEIIRERKNTFNLGEQQHLTNYLL